MPNFLKKPATRNDIKPGDTVTMYGEIYRVRKNYGESGEVEYLDGELASNNFFWCFQGDHVQKISHEEITKELSKARLPCRPATMDSG